MARRPRLRLPRVAVVVGGLLSMASPASAQPNVVVFLTDDLGVHTSPVFGGTDVSTPNMARLARRGMTFDRAYVVSPSCAPSRAAMLTGLYPSRNGAEANHTYPRDAVKKLPAFLRSHDYDVAAFGKVGHGARRQSDRYGFDHVVHRRDRLPERVRAYLSQRESDRPLCLFVGTSSPHRPWPPVEHFDPAAITIPPTHVDTPETRVQRARYYEDVRIADIELGRVFDLAMEELGEDTFFLFSSDHGANLPFGKWTLYEAGVRVPTIVVWNGIAEPGSRSDAMISWLDFLPTLIDIASGQSAEPTVVHPLDGWSFAPVLRGVRAHHRAAVFTTHTGDGKRNSYPIRAVRVGDWKYIRNLHPDAAFTTHVDQADVPDSLVPMWHEWLAAAETDAEAAARVDRYYRRPGEELYHLPSDPFEQHNVADDPANAERLEELRLAVDAWMAKTGDTRLVASPLRPLSDPVSYAPAVPPAEER